jgi:acyl-CoA synthetase (NDP forming)
LREAVRQFRQDAEACGIPVHGELARAVECLAAAAEYRPAGPGAPESAGKIAAIPPTAGGRLRENKNRIWDEFDSKRLLEDCGIPVVEEKLVSSMKEALGAARTIGYPVVLKGLVPGQVHKTESGLVRLRLAAAADLREAYREVKARTGKDGRVLLQKQAAADYELIAGFLRDPQFGPCVMFGLGGIFSELQRDVVFAPAELSREEAKKLFSRIKAGKLLRGFRGMSPLDENLMADILVHLGALGASCPEIEQIDINPLVVSKGRPTAVDATVIKK